MEGPRYSSSLGGYGSATATRPDVFISQIDANRRYLVSVLSTYPSVDLPPPPIISHDENIVVGKLTGSQTGVTYSVQLSTELLSTRYNT